MFESFSRVSDSTPGRYLPNGVFRGVPSAVLIVVFGVLVASPAALFAQQSLPVPFDSDRWEFSAIEARVEEHLGKSSLYLLGGYAWIADDEFVDGILEFDVALPPERVFAGAVWRMQEPGEYEEFYMRPHQSGNPDASQYNPAFYGLSSWQLYHGEGYSAQIDYRFDEWTHVKIVISGSRGEVYVDSDEPVLVINELKRPVRPGLIGLRVSSEVVATHFADFSYRKIQDPPLRGAPRSAAPTPAGTVTERQVSSAFEGSRLEGSTSFPDELSAELSWTALQSDRTGIANLAEVQGIADGRDTVIARLTIHSEQERVVKTSFGYSDRVNVYLNGQLLYGGDNTYRTRDYRYLGTIGLFDELWLPLKTGDNELWFAISEAFGGWGVQCRVFPFEELPAQTTATEVRVVVPNDGWELVGDLRLPASQQAAPAVLMLNKAADDRTVYEALAVHLANKGVASLRLDLRGHGESINLGRFVPYERSPDPLIWDSEVDVAAAQRYLRAHPQIDGDRIAVLGASYSGEEMAEAGRLYGNAQAYVALSPGSFSDESIDAIDSSGIPWLFIASRDERHLHDIVASLREKSHSVELLMVPGTEHASRLLATHPSLAERIAVTLRATGGCARMLRRSSSTMG